MKLTKYEHACFTVEKDNQTLVVDPGGFTTDFTASSNITCVVITHEHGDHFDQTQLEAIAHVNPAATVIAHPSITEKITCLPTVSVLPNETKTIGPFALTFYGGNHAIIHPDVPILANLGVLINETIYYPGDSFVRPDVPIDTLALPVGAPWLKISEAIDFLRDVKPRFVFPTHDAALSTIGKSLPDRLVPQLVPNTTYQRLADSIEL